MIGRSAWHNPWGMRHVDTVVFGQPAGSDPWEGRSRRDLVYEYLSYAERMLSEHGDFKSAREGVYGWPAATLAKPLIGLFAGEPGGKRFKNAIAQGIHAANASGHIKSRGSIACATVGAGKSAALKNKSGGDASLIGRYGAGGSSVNLSGQSLGSPAMSSSGRARPTLTSVLETAMEEIPVYVLDRRCGLAHDARWEEEKANFFAQPARDVRGPPGTPQTGNRKLEPHIPQAAASP